MKPPLATITVLIGLLALAACGGQQNALDSAGIQAGRLESLWWIFFWVTASVYVIVMVVLLIAVYRRRRADENTAPETKPDPIREQWTGNLI